ncbi:hypothetical protein JCGZ_01775 [Jatropha curcas]|uniref:Uncharacterized protein n=1 Tax=Jatropha curcas TaxID=180498 RepID=A0A067JTN7_JATCU|nr:hypothetical protein JCGZ_01775 [Jatropha curcas]
MEKWMKSNVKASKKYVLLNCARLKGTISKDNWELWGEKLGMDVMDARDQIHAQPWLIDEVTKKEEEHDEDVEK